MSVKVAKKNNLKLKQEIFNSVNENVKALESLFPSAVKDGQVDFKALKEELGQFEEVDKEKYELTWSGKQNAKKQAQQDILGKTLKYIPEDSKNPETTENLYIEGDNLEVLKLLRQNYYGSIKMIYIDPPYNTGNDFIYNDKFSMTKEESDMQDGTTSELGERYTVNKDTSNRYHANWLNMMYPRLKVAKDLLTDDGVILISIDDNEMDNLKKICDEIFGEDNYLGPIIQNKQNAKNDTLNIQKNHEFIIVYRKNCVYEDNIKVKPSLIKKSLIYKYAYQENDEFYYINDAITTRGEGGTLNARPNLGYTVYYNQKTDHKIAVCDYDIKLAKISNDIEKIYQDDIDLINNGYTPIRPPKVRGKLGCWTWSLEKFNQDNKNIIITGKPNSYSVKKRTFIPKESIIYIDNKLKYVSNTLSNSRSILDFSTNDGTNILNQTMKQSNVFNNPKNLNMILYLLSLVQDNTMTILDFFSGSSTTAHAVMQFNAEDGGNRKFIMVQLPEETSEKSEAYKAGYKNICEIGKERIRRAGEKIKEENKDKEGIEDLDVGFKVFRVGDTNIRWNYETVNSSTLDMFKNIENSLGEEVATKAITPLEEEYYINKDGVDFMPNSKDIDIVYEILLRQRDIHLSEKVELLSDIGERTYLFADSYLVCLEKTITKELIEKIASLDPLPIKFVFRDSAFEDNIDLKDETIRRLKALIDKNSEGNKVVYTVEFI